MRACLYRRHGGPDVLEMADLPDPHPGPGQVLVALEAASVAPLDWKLRAGLLAQYFTPDFPKIPGRDGTGQVMAIGAGVGNVLPGQRVAVMAPPAPAAGCYATMIAAEAALTTALPDQLDMAEGAALVNSGLSALIACRTAGVTPGQRVLIHAGAGAVGGLLVQLCAHLGAEVSTTCHSRNLGYVRNLGATHAIAYDGGDLTTLPPQDVVFDLVGGGVHEASYPVLKRGGHLVWLAAAPIVERGAEFGVMVTRAMIADDAAIVAEVLDLAARKVLKAQIADRLPLDQAAEAQWRLEAGQVSRGRLILQI
ncbi:MAG: NADP-dependent oxidoreductase [Pseudorhodobacter sp.]